jgi:hypothetical protein
MILKMNFPEYLFVTVLFVACGGDDLIEPDGSGPQWAEAFDASGIGAFMNIWGTGPEDVYTVGGQPESGVAYHFDGVSWSELDVPEGEMLYWVYGVDNEVFIVGSGGRALHRVGDGPFETMETGTDQPMWGVWGASADQIYAVGGDALNPDTPPLMMFWDGASWSEIEIPELDRNTSALFKVWGTSVDNVYVVGGSGVIIHYDGTSWSQESSGTTEDLVSLWGTGPDEILVAGGRSNGVIVRWDGESWDAQVLSGVPGLNGMWVDDSGRASVVGLRGTVVTISPGAFDTDLETSGTSLVLHGSWGVTGGPRFAVGGSLDRSPPFEGVVIYSE